LNGLSIELSIELSLIQLFKTEQSKLILAKVYVCLSLCVCPASRLQSMKADAPRPFILYSRTDFTLSHFAVCTLYIPCLTATTDQPTDGGSSSNARVVDRRVFYRPSLSITCNLVYLFIHLFISIVVSDSCS